MGVTVTRANNACAFCYPCKLLDECLLVAAARQKPIRPLPAHSPLFRDAGRANAGCPLVGGAAVPHVDWNGRKVSEAAAPSIRRLRPLLSVARAREDDRK